MKDKVKIYEGPWGHVATIQDGPIKGMQGHKDRMFIYTDTSVYATEVFFTSWKEIFKAIWRKIRND